MTKRILIFIYIAFVLMLSGLAKAQNSIVNGVELNQASGILTAHGVLSTPCQSRPFIAVDKIDETTSTVELNVTSSNTHTLCIDVLGERFNVALDLKELPLSEGRTYTVKFNNAADGLKKLKYTALKDEESTKTFKVNKQNFKGLLISLAESGFVLSNGNQRVQVVSPQIDLALFQNNQVWLSGYVVHMASISNDTDANAHTVIIPVSIGGVKP